MQATVQCTLCGDKILRKRRIPTSKLRVGRYTVPCENDRLLELWFSSAITQFVQYIVGHSRKPDAAAATDARFVRLAC